MFYEYQYLCLQTRYYNNHLIQILTPVVEYIQYKRLQNHADMFGFDKEAKKLSIKLAELIVWENLFEASNATAVQ